MVPFQVYLEWWFFLLKHVHDHFPLTLKPQNQEGGSKLPSSHPLEEYQKLAFLCMR